MSGSRTDPSLQAQPGPSWRERSYEVDLRRFFLEHETMNLRQLYKVLDGNGVKIVNRKGWKKLQDRDRDSGKVFRLTKLVRIAESDKNELRTLLDIKEYELETCKNELSASQELLERNSTNIENLLQEVTQLEDKIAEDKRQFQNDLASTQDNLADNEAKLQKALRKIAKYRVEKMQLKRSNVQLTEERKSFERKWKSLEQSKSEFKEKLKSKYEEELQKNLQLSAAIRNIANESGFPEEDIAEDYISRLSSHVKSLITLNSAERNELDRKRQLFLKFNSICKLVTAEAEFKTEVLPSNSSGVNNTTTESTQAPVTDPCYSVLDEFLGINVTPVRRKSYTHHNRKLQQAILRRKKHTPWSSGPVHGSYLCSCGSKFSARAALIKHVNYFTKEWMFECPCANCKEKFLYFSGLKQHLIQYHQNSELLQEYTIGCYLCGIMFKTRNEYSAHRKQVHNLQDMAKRTKPRKASSNNPIQTVNLEMEPDRNQPVPPGSQVEYVDIADDSSSCIGETQDDASTKQSTYRKSTPQMYPKSPEKTLVIMIRCDSCMKHFHTYKEWRNHILTSSNACQKDNGFRCNVCFEHFRNVKIFNVHKLKSHGNILT